MNTFEFSRKLANIDENVIRQIGIESVHENSEIVISDAIVSNAEGLTFAGNQINEKPHFKDWEETGQTHGNLKFRDESDIEFTSQGEGWEAINEAFDFVDTAAPTTKILSQEAKSDLRKSFLKKLKAWQAN